MEAEVRAELLERVAIKLATIDGYVWDHEPNSTRPRANRTYWRHVAEAVVHVVEIPTSLAVEHGASAIAAGLMMFDIDSEPDADECRAIAQAVLGMET